VKVDLRQEGQQLAQVPRATPAYETSVYDTDTLTADRRIREIVAANIGEPTTRRVAHQPPSSVAHVNSR
jgi:hypothetical protein